MCCINRILLYDCILYVFCAFNLWSSMNTSTGCSCSHPPFFHIQKTTYWLDLPIWRSLSLSSGKLRELLSSDLNCNHSVMRNPWNQIRNHTWQVSSLCQTYASKRLIASPNQLVIEWPRQSEGPFQSPRLLASRRMIILVLRLLWCVFLVCVIPHCQLKKGHRVRGSLSMIDLNRYMFFLSLHMLSPESTNGAVAACHHTWTAWPFGTPPTLLDDPHRTPPGSLPWIPFKFQAAIIQPNDMMIHINHNERCPFKTLCQNLSTSNQIWK